VMDIPVRMRQTRTGRACRESGIQMSELIL
jgi:hypothetical protein